MGPKKEYDRAKAAKRGHPNHHETFWRLGKNTFRHPDRITRFTFWVAIFTACLFITAFVQTWAFIQSERATLFFQVTTIVPFPFVADTPMTLQVNVTNAGRTQAFITAEKIAIHLGGLPREPEYPIADLYRAKGPVPAGSTRHIFMGPTIRLLTSSEISEINGGHTQLYVYGFAKFTDDFSILGSREVGFCVVYNPDDPTKSPGPRLDDCDNSTYVYSK
jgi:hypothetical protein